MKHCFDFSEITRDGVARFGGKNASLGEMTRKLQASGVRIPKGFALDASAFEATSKENRIHHRIQEALSVVNPETLDGLETAATTCQELVGRCFLPALIREELLTSYRKMGSPSVAVRSSATAEDLPTASFAGQHESFLNVEGEDQLLRSVIRCYSSLYTARAIKYRIDNGFPHEQVLLSVGIQQMVRSDLGSAGVAFTLDPESGFRNVIYVTGAW
ncbi:MAG: PEP/pyruvate-binding domain-containing protein, partial [Flavobacteriales bacterium]